MSASALTIGLVIVASQLQVAPALVSTTPVDRLSEDWWRQRHDEKVALTSSGTTDIAFLGDSITHGWEGAGKAVWDKAFSQWRCANFGYSGDRTEHVLWRLANGELIAMHPKLVVMMIGTNNVGHGSSSPAQTAEGIREILRTLQAHIPAVKILLLEVFPRDLELDDRLRLAVYEINTRLRPLAQKGRVEVLNIGGAFLAKNGQMDLSLMPDQLHPNEKGYEAWAGAIKDKLASMLR